MFLCTVPNMYNILAKMPKSSGIQNNFSNINKLKIIFSYI